MTRRLCSFDGCDRPSRARGLCSSHYVQQHRGGPLKPLRLPLPHGPTCGFEGCDRPYSARGFCKGHRTQLRTGRPLAPLYELWWTMEQDIEVIAELFLKPKHRRDWESVAKRTGRTRRTCGGRSVTLKREYPRLKALTN